MGSDLTTFRNGAGVSLTSPSTTDKPSLASKLEERTIRLGPALYAFRRGAALTAAERPALASAIADLSERLATAIAPNGGETVEAVAELVCANFKARDDDSANAAIYRGFLIALPGHSAPAAQEAVRRLIREEAPGFSPIWRPTPAEFAKLVKQIEAEWRLERDRLARLLTLEEEAVREEPEVKLSEEEMAALRERIKRLTAGATMPAAGTAGRSPDDGKSPAARIAEATAAKRAARKERGSL